jgi:CheY-like chemotaxis protein
MNSPKTIMIIDDDADFVDATQRILESAGYKVESARSSAEAKEKLPKIVPDLVILDMMMQRGAEGYVLARKIKGIFKTKRMPILVVTSITQQTGYEWEGDPRHPELFPVEEIMEKPVPAQKLLAKIEELLAAETKP